MAALRIRRYEYWAGGYRHDEDTVLGEFPAGQADDVWISIDEARTIVIEAVDAMGRLLDMTPTAEVIAVPVLAVPQPVEALTAAPKQTKPKRGPDPDVEKHRKVAEILAKYKGDWQHSAANLEAICAELDAAKVPISKAWEKWDWHPHTWTRALDRKTRPVVQHIDYCLKMDAKRRP